MKPLMTALLLAVAAHGAPAYAQSVIVDLTQSAGGSTEPVAVAGTQVRVLGEWSSGLRFHLEAAWGARTTDEGDAGGGAYPYDDRVAVMEAYVERMFRPGGALLGVRAGRYRTPFGISSASDHAYIGFQRPPLVRYDDYFALSPTFLEHGVDVVVGTPQVSVEASVGVPADVGHARRRTGMNTVLRGQWFRGPVIVGVSYLRTRPFQPARFARGRAEFGGLDARWMHGGVQVRGEWLSGRPFDGARTDGGYVDVIVHRPAMGPVTALLRVERLVYRAAPPFAFTASRYTAGVRIRVVNNLSVSVAILRHRSNESDEHLGTAMDVGVTYAIRFN